MRPPDFVRVVKEQIIFVYKYEFKNIAALKVFCFSGGSLKSFVGWECLL